MMDLTGPMTAFLGSLGFSMLFNVRGWRLLAGALGGGLTWTLYLALEGWSASPGLSYGLSALAAALYAQVMARRMKSPATVFLVPCIIPLIPGGMLYHTMLEMVRGQWEAGVRQGMATLTVAGAIAIGLAAASSLEAVLKAMKRKVKK